MNNRPMTYSEVIVFEILMFGHSTANMAPSVYNQLKTEGFLTKTAKGRIKVTKKAISHMVKMGFLKEIKKTTVKTYKPTKKAYNKAKNL